MGLGFALGILELYVLVYITSVATIEGFKDFLLDGFDRLHYVFLRPEGVLHSLAICANLSLMMCIRLCLDLFSIVRVRKLLETIPETIMVLLFLEKFIDKVGDTCSKGIIIILAISIDHNITMFEGSLITVN